MNRISRIIVIIFTSLFFLIAIQLFMSYRELSPYLSDETLIMPKIEFDNSSLDQMNEKIKLFSDKNRASGGIIKLNETDVNLILKNKFNLGDRLRATISENRLYIVFSIPLSFFGKFLNGSAVIAPEYKNANLKIIITSLIANNIMIDKEVISIIEDFFIKYQFKAKSISNFLSSCSEISVKENELVFLIK